jgi:hypothetical protein
MTVKNANVKSAKKLIPIMQKNYVKKQKLHPSQVTNLGMELSVVTPSEIVGVYFAKKPHLTLQENDVT